MIKITKLSIWIILLLPSLLFAQFGKNKVQYRTFDWKYIQSKNFDVYYYDSKYLAEVTALYAEEALVKKIVRKLTQSEWTIYGAIIILAVIFGAVLLAVAITGGLH